jgi:hypothetical protein
MKPVEKMNKEELIQELYSLSQSLQKTEARACALEHPKARTDAEREAPRLRALLAIRP